MKSNFPNKLVKTFIAWKKDKENDKTYKAYDKQVKKYLGNKYDGLEHSKITVKLSTETAKLFEPIKVKEDEKEAKTKTNKDKKPTRNKRTLQEGRSDEGPKEGSEQEQVPVEKG